MKDWLRDLCKAFLMGCAGAAALFAVSFLIALAVRGGVSGGLDGAKSVLLVVGALGLFLLAGMLLVRGKKPEAFSAGNGWRKHFRAAGVKTVLAAWCAAALLAAVLADYLSYR